MEDDRKVSPRQRYKLGLNKVVGFGELDAAGMLELREAACSGDLVPSTVLKLSTPNKHLYVIFPDSRQCKEWQDALSHQLKRPEQQPVLRKNLLGNIYDISEHEKSSAKMWREMKVTFVRQGGDSSEEFLMFDTTLDDLEDSLREVMGATADKTDVSNSEILRQYLLDVTAFEELKRANDSRGAAVSKSPENLSAYGGVNQVDVNQKLFTAIQKSQDSSNVFTQAFQLMLAQKLSQTVRLATIAAVRRANAEQHVHQERRHERVASHPRKRESHLSPNVIRGSDSLGRGILSSSNEEEARPKTWFREACECKLF
jgi:hypothetical protein